MNVNQEICNAFSAHAREYEYNAKVQTEIGSRLLERLDYLMMQPQYVLDLGCGTGNFTSLLKQRYPNATIIGFDLSAAMLQESSRKSLNQGILVQGDMQCLPFANGTFDLVFSNQTIHWANPVSDVFRELNRVMRLDGCLMFTTLGPDTFHELKKAWLHGDAFAHTNDFMDMHNIGDHLMAERFLEPVVDMEVLTVHYLTLFALIKNLKAQGVRNMNPHRNAGLTGKKAWKRFEAAFEQFKTPEGKCPLTYEIIYGHAWKGKQVMTEKGLETFFPLSQLRRSLKG